MYIYNIYIVITLQMPLMHIFLLMLFLCALLHLLVWISVSIRGTHLHVDKKKKSSLMLLKYH